MEEEKEEPGSHMWTHNAEISFDAFHELFCVGVHIFYN